MPQHRHCPDSHLGLPNSRPRPVRSSGISTGCRPDAQHTANPQLILIGMTRRRHRECRSSQTSAVSPAELTHSFRHRGEGAFRMSVRRNLRLTAKSDHTWTDQPAATSSPIPDHVLLGCFGPELAGSRHRRHLCAALQRAGYQGPLAQHLIQVSPLLISGTGRRYRLKRCDETPS